MDKAQLIADCKQMLCPPGNGVFTVHTGQENRQSVQEKLYPSQDPQQAWALQMEHLASDGKPWLLGIASDCGGGIMRGANWGPLYVRQALYHEFDLQEKLFDIGDVRVIPHLLHDKYLNQDTISRCRNALYENSDSDYPVSPLSIAERVAAQLWEVFPEQKLLSIGGDHSISYPLTKAFFTQQKKRGSKVGLLHFDAHTDLLVERLGIDICFGSWVTPIIPLLPHSQCLVQVGIRSTGKSQAYWQETYGITQHWARDIKEQGAEQIAKNIVTHYKSLGISGLYVSFDIDALDQSIASATGTPETDGLSVEDCVTIIEACKEHFPIFSADLAEVAPMVNHPGKSDKQQPRTTLAAAGEIMECFI